MRRREFISGALGAGIAVRKLSAQPLGLPDGMILALAEVIVPDRDRNTWKSGSVADAFVRLIRELDPVDSSRVETSTRTAAESADREWGTALEQLAVDARLSLVRQLLETNGEFKAGFILLRGAALKAFYSSSLGWERAGFHETTQFIGYPEYLESAETWE